MQATRSFDGDLRAPGGGGGCPHRSQADAQRRAKAWDEQVVASFRSGYDARTGVLAQAEVLGAVDEVMDARDVVVCAAGSLPGDLHGMWRTRDRKGYHVEYGYSCMGYEIPGGIGIALAAPDRDVFVTVGDGSYLMMPTELVTAVQEGVKVIVVLLQNHGYASIGSLAESTAWTTRSAWPNSSDCRPRRCDAIQELVDKGLLVRKRGVGTQVVHGQVTRPVELTSLFDDLTRRHQAPTTTVLANEVVAAPNEVCALLSIAPGSPVLHLRRLRFAHGEPLAILENFLPGDLIKVGASDLAVRGLYQVMRSRGVNIRVAKQKIGARTGTAEECSLLGERKGGPVLTMERAVHDDSGRPVEWGRHAYRASRYSFEVTLVDH